MTLHGSPNPYLGIHGVNWSRNLATGHFAQSPWQDPFVERLIGTLRRHCLDLLIVLNERPFRHIVARY
jgi:hypothetical protein